MNEVLEVPTLWEIDNLPTREEVLSALSGLKNNKSAGPDSIPAELLKYGGVTVKDCLRRLFDVVWNTGDMPQQWKDSTICYIYKNKGDRAICGNSRGISLLSFAGKALARVILVRLLENFVDRMVPETQRGFRRERGTVDMVFIARQLQEKCREQHRELFMVFINLAIAFDTVPRVMLC